jgi:hypothetical protein
MPTKKRYGRLSSASPTGFYAPGTLSTLNSSYARRDICFSSSPGTGCDYFDGFNAPPPLATIKNMIFLKHFYKRAHSRILTVNGYLKKARKE